MEQRQVIQGKAKKQKRPALAGKKLPTEKMKRSAKEQKMLDVAFSEAAKKYDIADMERLLKAGANIETKFDKVRETALIRAASQGRTETCAFLIEKDANINAKDANGNTALMEAINAHNEDTFRLLLKKGADLTRIKNNFGFTAFEIIKASKNRHSFMFYILIISTDKLFLALMDEESGYKTARSFRSEFSKCISF